MPKKDTIRPIYSELQGFLAQSPDNNKSNVIFHEEIWNHFNLSVQELNLKSDKNYDSFLLKPQNYPRRNHKRMWTSSGGISLDIYKQKLGGLIARLYGEYFKDEPAPFANMPETIINQTQTQSVQIEIVLEINNYINDKLNAAKEGTKEKTFLEKVRSSLSKVKNVSQLIPLIISTAKEMDISVDELSNLFS